MLDEDMREREEEEACPDCRDACDEWMQDGNPCGDEPEDDVPASILDHVLAAAGGGYL